MTLNHVFHSQDFKINIILLSENFSLLVDYSLLGSSVHGILQEYWSG